MLNDNDLIEWFTALKPLDKIYLYESMNMLQAFKRLKRNLPTNTKDKTSMSHNIITPISDYEIDKFEDFINGG